MQNFSDVILEDCYYDDKTPLYRKNDRKGHIPTEKTKYSVGICRFSFFICNFAENYINVERYGAESS